MADTAVLTADSPTDQASLAATPDAFLLTPVEAHGTPDGLIETGISSGAHWGVWKDDHVVAIATMRRGAVQRLHHTADIGPFYVRNTCHNQGIGTALLKAMIAHARSIGLLQLELCVDATNAAAIALYASAGFEVFGTRKRSVIIDGLARDDHLMMKKLD